MKTKPNPGARLRRYIATRKVTIEAFSLAIKTDSSAVFRWLAGKSKPSEKNKSKVHKWTNGAVASCDWQ